MAKDCVHLGTRLILSTTKNGGTTLISNFYPGVGTKRDSTIVECGGPSANIRVIWCTKNKTKKIKFYCS